VRMVPLFSSLSANDSPSISLISNGNSTGQSFVMQMVDRSGEVKDVALPEGTVLQPLKRDSKKEIAQKASTAARHMLTQNVSAFCLEYAKLPPEAGMFYRVADKALQEQYKPLISYIKAGRKLFSDGKFQPDSKPDQYATSIMQFTIWALIGHWDEKSFAQMFLERTKKNAEANGVKWTKEMENAILAAAPGRWRDISQVVALGNEMGTKAEVTHAVPATTATAITPRLDQP